MNKKLLALAVAGAVYAPAALAQGSTSTVTLYGLVDISLQSQEAKGATQGGAAGTGLNLPRRTKVDDTGASRLGVRGVEPLGGGLEGWFQIESAINPDVGGGTLASRNTAVGLRGGFGTVLLGRWDTPYKLASLPLDPFGDVYMAGYTTVMHGHSNFRQGGFDRRENNSVQYWTPNLAGLTARLHYGAGENKTNSSNPQSFAASLVYDQGPIYAFYSYEQHKDQLLSANQPNGGNCVATAGNASECPTKATGNEVGIQGRFGGFKVGYFHEEIKYENKAGTVGGKKVKADFVSGSFNTGAHTLKASYGKNKGVSKETEIKAWGLGYEYAFSKRTSLNLTYADVKNESGAFADFGFSGIGMTSANAGADPRGFGAGLKHTF